MDEICVIFASAPFVSQPEWLPEVTEFHRWSKDSRPKWESDRIGTNNSFFDHRIVSRKADIWGKFWKKVAAYHPTYGRSSQLIVSEPFTSQNLKKIGAKLRLLECLFQKHKKWLPWCLQIRMLKIITVVSALAHAPREAEKTCANADRALTWCHLKRHIYVIWRQSCEVCVVPLFISDLLSVLDGSKK